MAKPSERGGSINCFALLSQDSRLHRYLTEQTITAPGPVSLDALSLSPSRLTVVVLDNASVHTKAAKERRVARIVRALFSAVQSAFQQRGGFAAQAQV